jgi:hypothetical protein
MNTLVIGQFNRKTTNTDIFSCLHHILITWPQTVIKDESEEIDKDELCDFDVVILIGSIIPLRNIVLELRSQFSGTICFLAFEDPYEFRFALPILPKVDLYLTNDPNLPSLFNHYSKIHYFPLGVCTECITPTTTTKINNPIFIGNAHPERIILFDKIKKDFPLLFQKINFVGSGWDKLIPKHQIINEHVSRRLASYLYGKYLLSINIERFSDIEGNYLSQPNSGVNTRILEIGAAKGAVLSLNSGFQTLLTLGRDSIFVETTFENFIKKLEFLLNKPQLCLETADRLNKLVVSQFSLEKRILDLFNLIIRKEKI